LFIGGSSGVSIPSCLRMLAIDLLISLAACGTPLGYFQASL
jgi:hypothetical protein